MATAGVYWTSWWSPTKCHIKTLMISINYHGHGLYLLVLIFFFPLCLIMLLHFKNRQLFLAHPVYVTIINVYCRPYHVRMSVLRMYKLANVVMFRPWNFGLFLPNTHRKACKVGWAMFWMCKWRHTNYLIVRILCHTSPSSQVRPDNLASWNTPVTLRTPKGLLLTSEYKVKRSWLRLDRHRECGSV
jgi:hypothetical protein